MCCASNRRCALRRKMLILLLRCLMRRWGWRDNTARGTRPMITKDITYEYIAERNGDWIARLEGLYDQIDGWRTALEIDTQAVRQQTVQQLEELMRRVGFEPQK